MDHHRPPSNNRGFPNHIPCLDAEGLLHLTIEPHITEQLAGEQAGHEVLVTIIQGGTSRNGYDYNDEVLRTIAHLVEGAQAYADHARNSADTATRSVRDVVGFYHDAHFIAANADQSARVDAALHIFAAAAWLWSLIQEAVRLGRPELVGLSIDVFGQWQLNEQNMTKEVTCITSLNSCDIVTRPSAGGAIRRILHDESQESPEALASPNHPRQGERPAMSQQPLSQEQQEMSHASTQTGIQIQEEQHTLEQQRLQIEQLFAQARLERAALLLERRLQESILPQAVKEQIRRRYQDRIFEEHDLETDLTSAISMMAQLSKEGIVRGNSYEKEALARTSSHVSEAEKIQAAFDKMFDLDIDSTRLGTIHGFQSIREAYARVTGDASLLGGISDYTTLGQARVSENAPLTRISEADVTTVSFSYLLGTSMNKRLLKDYQAWPAEWSRFCTIVPIRDFKQQSRVRLGAFGSLPVVAEDSAYTTVTLNDSAAVYVPQKRGNLVTVSRETIINDDLQAIKQIPTKLAVAAAYTLAEFVYAFLSDNPNIYDGSALFTSGAPHSNLGAAALSTSSMQLGVTAMREQTNYAGKRIGLRPRFLIVPPELEWVSMVATRSAGVPGSPNNDINPMLGYVTPIVAPQLSSATQWFLAADPREVDTIEIGFVGGQLNPALFIQDSPLLGLNFSQDAISYKCRHEYGGCVTDFRGLYRGL
jgi:hypothetical protein